MLVYWRDAARPFDFQFGVFPQPRHKENLLPA